mgnify:FL=1
MECTLQSKAYQEAMYDVHNIRMVRMSEIALIVFYFGSI